MSEKVLFSWSGGKDSALALYELSQNPQYEITALLTTVTEGYERVSMHGVRRDLLERQAVSLGYGLEVVYIPKDCSTEEYGQRMREALTRYKAQGISINAFGDIHLTDVRAYRESKLREVGMHGIFPIWGRDTGELARRFVDVSFKAVITCVDTKVLAGEFSGREYDEAFLAELPESVDPCGENGEFHTFVYAGPIFRWDVKVARGDKTLREERYCYCDLLAGPDAGPSIVTSDCP